MIACAISITYWLMRVSKILGATNQLNNEITNSISTGLALYSNQDATAGHALFGGKPMVTENTYPCGVVATSNNPDGLLDGFAIFEIEGKPTNAITVGETNGKSLSLQSTGDESIALLYQGQKLSFSSIKPIKTHVRWPNKAQRI
jgi:hypothetical protein